MRGVDFYIFVKIQPNTSILSVKQILALEFSQMQLEVRAVVFVISENRDIYSVIVRRERF